MGTGADRQERHIGLRIETGLLHERFAEDCAGAPSDGTSSFLPLRSASVLIGLSGSTAKR